MLSSSSNKTDDNNIDSLLQKQDPQEEENSKENNIPYIDTYNNPFARNPIFSDDVEKIVGKGENQEKARPNYNFNECLELIRDSIKNIEASGFKVDSEETNLEKNYQIVIKIEKKEEEAQK